MSALTVYKIFTYSMILILFALYWPLRAASARVRKEIDQLKAENDADSRVGCGVAGIEDIPRQVSFRSRSCRSAVDMAATPLSRTSHEWPCFWRRRPGQRGPLS